jgi:cytochrome c553
MRMKILGSFTSVALMLSACSFSSHGPPEAVSTVTPQELAFCSQCHYEEGTSAKPDVPKIAGQYDVYLQHAVENFIEGKRDSATMQRVASLHTEQEMKKLAHFFSQQQPDNTAATNPAVVHRGVWSRGQELFETKRVYNISCASCHGYDAMGYAYQGRMKNIRAIPRLAGQEPLYLISRLQSYKDGKVQAGMCTMRKAGTTLSEDDIKALAEYLASLTPPSK